MRMLKAALWMVPGAAITLLVILAAHSGQRVGLTEQLTMRTKRADLAGRLQLALSSAAEAEKSAVMAVTDEDSQLFAQQARAATADADRSREELEATFATDSSTREKELLGQFSKSFADLKRIDGELLALAVKNTNVKAYRLAFGPAAQAVQEMNDALNRITLANAETSDATKITQFALAAETSALRVQTLLPPHIAEESDQKMDQLEAVMAKEDGQVLGALHRMKALPGLKGSPDLATAESSYSRFTELKGQILALSRENTNVRSLAISLNQKRKVELLSQDALSALKQAILEEPVRGVTYDRPVSPR